MCSRRDFDFAPLNEEDVPQNQNPGSAHFFILLFNFKKDFKNSPLPVRFLLEFILRKNIKTGRRRRGCCHKW